jgi:hypothetical protein
MLVEVLKPTNDDWCDSYVIEGHYNGDKNQMLVEVSFRGEIAPGVWRTSVWGNDDFGMEYDCDSETKCWNMFLRVIGMRYVDAVPLRQFGFVTA